MPKQKAKTHPMNGEGRRAASDSPQPTNRSAPSGVVIYPLQRPDEGNGCWLCDLIARLLSNPQVAKAVTEALGHPSGGNGALAAASRNGDHPADDLPSPLTATEQRVAQALVDCCCDLKAAQRALRMNAHTLRTLHLVNLRRKMKARTTPEAVLRALRRGLVRLTADEATGHPCCPPSTKR